MSRTDESQTIPGDDLQSAARRAVILAEIDATNEMSGPSNSCCSDGVCFIEPPATAIGMDGTNISHIFLKLLVEKVHACWQTNYNLFLLLSQFPQIFFGLCSGLSIRCLLSQNGLDVEWINPENEVAQAPKSVLITDFLNDYDDDDESSSNEWGKHYNVMQLTRLLITQ